MERANRMEPHPGGRIRSLLRDAIGFGLVGSVGMVVDVLVFNALRVGVLGSTLGFTSKPLTAAACSALLAIAVNWLGSRYWVFRKDRRQDVLVEAAEYLAVALLGLGIGLATLAFTHYTLGLTSLAADNISRNIVGLAVGTIARFLLIRFWVWGEGRSRARVAPPPSRHPVDLARSLGDAA